MDLHTNTDFDESTPRQFFFLCYFIPLWVDVYNETKRVLSFVQSNDASRSGTCFMTLGVAIQRESSQWGSQIFGLVVRNLVVGFAVSANKLHLTFVCTLKKPKFVGTLKRDKATDSDQLLVDI